jgi:hypothetical protein
MAITVLAPELNEAMQISCTLTHACPLHAQQSGLAVFTAYFDSARAQATAPDPWFGSDNTIFCGDDPTGLPSSCLIAT